jgi:hypothetical protein
LYVDSGSDNAREDYATDFVFRDWFNGYTEAARV